MTLCLRAFPAVVALLVGCSDQQSSPLESSTTISVAPTTVTSTTLLEPTTSVVVIDPTSTSTSIVTEVSAVIDGTTTAASSTVPAETSHPEWLRPDLDYLYPIPASVNSGYQGTHSGYPATDVFASCGAPIVAPVHGVIHDLRRSDPWDPASDDPYARGGKFISILGDDSVRYYLAHFEAIEQQLQIGSRVVPGQKLGEVGTTGRSSACHLHFAISPLCPNDEWWVRRGVIWPYSYFDAWRSGQQLSPVSELETWSAANPNRCNEP